VWIAGRDAANPRRLTTLNPKLDSVSLGTSRLIRWVTSRGDTLRGALLLPASYAPGRRYPLVVKLYAGSTLSNNVNRFGGSGPGVENFQLLSSRGYAVLLPDVPQRLGSPMKDIADAVLPALDTVVAMGVADPNAIGVTGHSYGGYSTLALITQSTRFKAAVSSAGPANLVAMYGQMGADGGAFGIGWSETGQGLMGGTPWQYRDRYVENSPITYLDRVTTPLLIVQGGIDHTVPPWQSDAVFVGLRRLGKEVAYARYDGEDHWEGTWSPANATDYWKRVISWFDDHLKTASTTPHNER
jgi:dipeptidyl aminopeptidase/acylaminoacyl peptidase